MVEVAPFTALRYTVEDPSSVVCPPYDVISDEARSALENRDPHNAVRLVLPQGAPGRDRYAEARKLLERWRADGVLTQDATPSLTIYDQTYEVAGERRTQRGLLAAVRLEEPEAGGVLPHERTYDDIVDDRLRLLRATQTNLDCIFCVYESDGAPSAIDAATEGPPLTRFVTDDGVEHALWRADDPATIAAVAAELEKPRVVIADGHHRWRTASRYREERRARDGEGPWDLQLMLLVDASRMGPSLLPIHRVLSGLTLAQARTALEPAFRFERADASDPELLAKELAAKRAGVPVFAMFDAAEAWWLTPADERAARGALPADRSDAWRALDVSLLHAFVFERLLGGVTPRFVHHASDAAAQIAGGEASVAFLLAPMPFESVRAVAEAGDAMPQKSTYFIPKPKTGVVFRPLA